MIKVLAVICSLLTSIIASDNAQYIQEVRATVPIEHQAYFDVHAKRYEKSLDLMGRYVTPGNLGSVLEVGGCSMMNIDWIQRIQPAAHFDLISGPMECSNPNVSIHSINIETQLFPIADKSIQTALFFEVFEHMSVDPMAPLAEINRVLAPDGILFLSTPNICSWWAMYVAFGGYQPNLYHKWSKNEPRTDRHNLEYSPQLLASVVRNAGFEIVELKTMDVYEHAHIERAKLEDFKARQKSAGFGLDENKHGDTQFMVLRKVSGVVSRYPDCLYE